MKYVKNKFIFTTALFLAYILFLDDVDIFTIVIQNRKLDHLQANKVELQQRLTKTQQILKELKYPSELEKFAREEKLFKKDDEDIFVVSYE